MDKNFKIGTRLVYMLVGMSGQVGAEVGGKQEEVVLQGSRWRKYDIEKKLRKWSGIGFAKERSTYRYGSRRVK